MRRLGGLVIGVCLISSVAAAQDTNRAEVSAGWRYYHATYASQPRATAFSMTVPNDFPQGWYADAALNVSPKFAVVGEAGGTRRRDEFDRSGTVVTESEWIEYRFQTYMGGIRVRAPHVPWFVPFGQVLFGGEHNSSEGERSFRLLQNTPFISRQDSASSNAVLALDGGTTLMFGPVGARVAVGYMRFFGTADADALRVSLGAAYRF
jgi:hypothetical protein